MDHELSLGATQDQLQSVSSSAADELLETQQIYTCPKKVDEEQPGVP